jgi:hypothetical protein
MRDFRFSASRRLQYAIFQNTVVFILCFNFSYKITANTNYSNRNKINTIYKTLYFYSKTWIFVKIIPTCDKVGWESLRCVWWLLNTLRTSLMVSYPKSSLILHLLCILVSLFRKKQIINIYIYIYIYININVKVQTSLRCPQISSNCLHPPPSETQLSTCTGRTKADTGYSDFNVQLRPLTTQ